jgi:hypothetical protein
MNQDAPIKKAKAKKKVIFAENYAEIMKVAKHGNEMFKAYHSRLNAEKLPVNIEFDIPQNHVKRSRKIISKIENQIEPTLANVKSNILQDEVSRILNRKSNLSFNQKKYVLKYAGYNFPRKILKGLK